MSIAVSTPTSVTQGGSLSVSFTLLTGTVASLSHKIADISSFKYIFDIPEEGSEVTKIGIKSGSVSIKFFDNESSLTYKSLYDAIINVATINDTVDATITLQLNSDVSSRTIPVRFKPQNVSYDINKRVTTIDFEPLRPEDNTTYSSVYDVVQTNPESAVRYGDGIGVSGLLMTGYDFVYAMLKEVYGTSRTPIIKSNQLQEGATLSASDSAWFVSDTLLGSTDYSPYEQLGVIAALEGAVFGDVLGSSAYFVRGISNQNLVSLNESDFKDLKIESIRPREYAYVKVTHDSEDFQIPTNPYFDGEKIFNVSFDKGYLDKRVVTSRNPNDVSSTSSFDDTLAEEGATSYNKSFGNQYSSRLSGIIFGCDTIEPYELISISFGQVNASRLPSSINGAYRFSNVEYNLPDDLIKFEAYKVS